MIDITAIMTGHREGLFAGPALQSFEKAAAHAEASGLVVERIIVLDQPDATTLEIFRELPPDRYRVAVYRGGEPALTRNYGVGLAQGRYIGFLDADDLWCCQWLTDAHSFCSQSKLPVVAHSEINIIFGGQRAAWMQADSLSDDFDIDYLKFGNYWDAMCFAARDIFLAHPYHCNDLGNRYGHEDWHWNNVSLGAGIAHRPVAGTAHFLRRRSNSQMSAVNSRDVVALPTPIDRYKFTDPLGTGVARRENAVQVLARAMTPEFFRATTNIQCSSAHYPDAPGLCAAYVIGHDAFLLPPIYDPTMSAAAVTFAITLEREVTAVRCSATTLQPERQVTITAQIEVVEMDRGILLAREQERFAPTETSKDIRVVIPKVLAGSRIEVRLSVLKVDVRPSYFTGVRFSNFGFD